MSNTLTIRIVLGVVAAIALAGGGFLTGMAVGANRAATDAAITATGTQVAGGAAGAAARRTGGPGGGVGQATSGRVLSVNSGSITVAVRQPGQQTETSSTIALVGSNTRVVRTSETDIKVEDIRAGDQVTIVGTADQTTGVLSATAVVVGGNALQQLFGGGQGGPGAGGGGAPRGSPSPSPAR